MKRSLSPAGRDKARPLQGDRSRAIYGGVWSPRPTGATQVMPSSGPTWASAPTERRESCIDHPGQRRTAKRLRRGCEEMGGNRGRDHPQSVQQRRTIPQSPCGRQLPLHKGAFGDGDADCRVASLLAMTVLILCHSEKAQRADVGIRLFYDGRGFGPSYLEHGLRRPNSVPKFGASVKSSAPTEGLPESQQRADVGIDPYGTKRELPRPPGQRSERGKSRWSNSVFAR